MLPPLPQLGGTVEQQLERKMAFVRELKCLPVAVQTAAANEQHYEVPTDYFVLVLGPHLKYSSCLYNSARNTLAEAEHNMLGGCPWLPGWLDGWLAGWLGPLLCELPGAGLPMYATT